MTFFITHAHTLCFDFGRSLSFFRSAFTTLTLRGRDGAAAAAAHAAKMETTTTAAVSAIVTKRERSNEKKNLARARFTPLRNSRRPNARFCLSLSHSLTHTNTLSLSRGARFVQPIMMAMRETICHALIKILDGARSRRGRNDEAHLLQAPVIPRAWRVYVIAKGKVCAGQEGWAG